MPFYKEHLYATDPNQIMGKTIYQLINIQPLISKIRQRNTIHVTCPPVVKTMYPM